MQSLTNNNITAVILAGGQGRRMGGQDKGLIEFNGQPIIELLIAKLRRQNIDIVINANRNRSAYQQYGYPVISDELTDYQGPLAGFAAAMAVVRTEYILTLPCDGPLLTDDFVEIFLNNHARQQKTISVADDGERLQPVYALIKVNLLDNLKTFLKTGDRKIDRWYAGHDYARVDFSTHKNMFGNINKPEDHTKLLEVKNA